MAFIILYFLACLIYSHGLPVTLLYLPMIVLSQLLLTAGISWFDWQPKRIHKRYSALMALALSAWMYATPIVYPATALQGKFNSSLAKPNGRNCF
jgi:lipopolysaccharide transport system permease protein